jgi:SNF2 family DNA or RNA helicase
MQTDDYSYKTEPYEHQVSAVRFCANKDTFALFMEQGTGKTKTTIDLASNWYEANQIQAVMLIAPNGVHEQWAREEVQKHSHVPVSGFLWKSNSRCAQQLRVWMTHVIPTKKGLPWLFINTEAFSLASYIEVFKGFLKMYRTLLVVDESTYIKNPDANRTAHIINGLSQCTMKGKRIVERKPLSVKRGILTGTQVTKGPYDLWAMFEFLQYNYFGVNFYAFKAKYGIERTVFFPGQARPIQQALKPEDFDDIRRYHAEGRSITEIASALMMRIDDVQYILDNPDVRTPYKNMKDLKERVAELAFTVTKEECLDLPPKVYQKLLVKMSPEQKKLYKSVLASAFAEHQGKELTVVNKIAVTTRLRQIAGGFFPYNIEYDEEGMELMVKGKTPIPIQPNSKIRAIINDLEEATTFPVIIACRYKAEAEAMAQACRNAKYDTVLVSGDVDKLSRTAALDKYKKNEVDVLCATIAAIARGHNLQNGSMMYIYSSDYDAELRFQLEDRIHRIGQQGTAVYKDVIMEGTIDELIADNVANKKAFLDFMRSSSADEFFMGLAKTV